jgi:putative tryptophan/tyrosine transport system substrate-binding protein
MQAIGSSVRRREFIGGLGATVLPAAARAQRVERTRRVGVLMEYDENDALAKTFLSGFTKALRELGWSQGNNLRLDVRWASGNVDRMQTSSKELLDLQPDVILSQSTPVTAALQRETPTTPIVFVLVVDPVGSGFVASLPRPGGNITGFVNMEASLAGKLLELLTEIAPRVKRATIIFNPDTTAGRGSYFLPSFEDAAHALKVEPIAAPSHNDYEVEAAIASLASAPGGGLVGMPDGFVFIHRARIISTAAQNNIPAVYPHSLSVRDGALLSYGPDFGDIFRRAASYVDRILRGANAADLPVQLPNKFVMALNLKTAKALALAVPQSILLRADEVIE